MRVCDKCRSLSQHKIVIDHQEVDLCMPCFQEVKNFIFSPNEFVVRKKPGPKPKNLSNHA